MNFADPQSFVREMPRLIPLFAAQYCAWYHQPDEQVWLTACVTLELSARRMGMTITELADGLAAMVSDLEVLRDVAAVLEEHKGSTVSTETWLKFGVDEETARELAGEAS